MCKCCDANILDALAINSKDEAVIINQDTETGEYFIDGLDERVYINYCPMCRKEAGRVKIGIHKARYRHSQWYYYLIPKRITLKSNPPLYKWLWFIFDLSKEESYDK